MMNDFTRISRLWHPSCFDKLSMAQDAIRPMARRVTRRAIYAARPPDADGPARHAPGHICRTSPCGGAGFEIRPHHGLLLTRLPYPILFWALVIVLAASLPYIVAAAVQPEHARFSGYVVNIDDDCVYSSWILQIADGNWMIRNQFTTEPQRALQFNVFFLALGLTARLFHLSPAAVFHLARILLGIALLLVVWKFSPRFLKDRLERLLIVPVVGLSSGIGWMLPDMPGFTGPVDLWQPEAITFLSIYANPLFLAGLILMIASIHFLLRMKETGSWRDASLAGLMLLLLGNVHTYDMVTVGVVWAAYLAAKTVRTRRVPWRIVGLSAAAAAMALPSVGYQLYLYSYEPVFRERVETQALSPAFWAYLMGYGLLLIGAAMGALIAVREKRGAMILAVWFIAGLMIPYAPVAQQRKLVMGLHLPVAILATIALVALVRRIGPRWGGIATILLIAATIPSNLIFIARDIDFIGKSRQVPFCSVYIPNTKLEAFRWLRDNTEPDDTVLAFPDVARFVPAVVGNRVYYGHWSETPDYGDRIREWMMFVDVSTPDEWKREYLRRTGARYIIYFSRPKGVVIQIDELTSISATDLRSAPYAKVEFEAGDTAVYSVRL
ncbi:MAG: hypothetical protein HYX78_13415 [Armatimonadetes bacterium]|nr:hypothetical protein [Armatimonadota bacterium]